MNAYSNKAFYNKWKQVTIGKQYLEMYESRKPPDKS